MTTKDQRLAKIRSLIGKRRIRSQSELLERLADASMTVDQSTLSRDLQELGITKVSGRYVLQETEHDETESLDLSPAVLDWTTCGPHLIVVHTTTGQAQAVGLAIDRRNGASIEGTLSGDDTVFLATKTRQLQTVTLRRLAQWFGER